MKKAGRNRFPSAPPLLTPDEIFLVRVSLGLSEIEAGRIIGGGDRAFFAYEKPAGSAGAKAPSQALSNLLRAIFERPSILEVLRRGADAGLKPGISPEATLRRVVKERRSLNARSRQRLQQIIAASSHGDPSAGRPPVRT